MNESRRMPAIAAVLWLGGALGGCGEERSAVAPVAPASAPAGAAQLDAPIVAPVHGDVSQAATHVALARREIGLGHPEEAKRELQAALAADPANLEALLLRGIVGLQKSFAYEPLQALAAYRTARLVDPSSTAAKVGEAAARVALEDDVGAAPLLDELIEADERGSAPLAEEQRALVHRSRGQLALRAGRFDAALLEAERALKLRETDRATLQLRAEVFERMGRPADALADLEIGLSLRGDDSSLHFAASRVLRKLGRGEEAARHQKAYEALRRFEEDASKAFREDARLRIALRREFVAAWPEWKRGRHLLVRELLAGSDLAAAQVEVDALLAADVGDPEAWFLQAKVRVAQRDFAAARAAADRMMATGKVAPPVRDELLREIEQAAAGGSDGGARSGGG